MLGKRDYYSVLGVRRNASSHEIRRSHRKLARQFHPDVNRDNPRAAQRFCEIQEAYEVISDPDKRSEYDAACGFAPLPVPIYAPHPGKAASTKTVDLLSEGGKYARWYPDYVRTLGLACTLLFFARGSAVLVGLPYVLWHPATGAAILVGAVIAVILFCGGLHILGTWLLTSNGAGIARPLANLLRLSTIVMLVSLLPAAVVGLSTGHGNDVSHPSVRAIGIIAWLAYGLSPILEADLAMRLSRYIPAFRLGRLAWIPGEGATLSSLLVMFVVRPEVVFSGMAIAPSLLERLAILALIASWACMAAGSLIAMVRLNDSIQEPGRRRHLYRRR